jgi:hypothetical protein
MFIPGGIPSPSDLASKIAADALILRASRTLAVHADPWWAVAADVDWLAAAPVPVDELFRRIVPFPEAGVNSMRSEILLTAFADDVLTWNGNDQPYRLKGVADDWHAIRNKLADATWKRVIAFRLVSANLDATSPASVTSSR